MSEILNDNSKIIGQIYCITNINTNKQYIGQTVSHRLNHKKYRPFGYLGRFKQHISKSICNTDIKDRSYLHNSIRLYGAESFKIELIMTCSLDELDNSEINYIKEYNTLYPTGYNLTNGGKNGKVGGGVFRTPTDNNDTNDDKRIEPINEPKKRGGCTSRSAETRAKMTESLKQVMGTSEARKEQMLRSQKQHTALKLTKFTGIKIDLNNIESYLKIRNAKDGSKFIKIIIGNKTTSFTGKYETTEELKEKAIKFIKSIHNSATLPNCSGTP